MTAVAVQDESWRIGSTIPRLYTPPLTQHIDESAEYGIKPEATWGYDCIDFLENVAEWELLPWQRWLYCHALEKQADGTGFRFQTALTLVSRQNGKLIDIDEPVLTTDGWKRMGDLQDGDYVFHPDGHPTQIVKAHDVEYGQPAYRVTTSDGRSVVAGGEHQWAVRDRRKRATDWEVLTTDEIAERGLQRQPNRATKNDYAFRLPNQKRIVSKPVGLPIDPYLLGLWLGDGSSTSPIIYAGDQDFEETKRLIEKSGAGIGAVTRVENKTGGVVWNICFRIEAPMRDGFEARCRRIGIWGNKHVPNIYLTSGTEQRQELLAGLLDSDGSISKAGQVEFCSTRIDLAEAVLYLARSLGYRATLKEHRATLRGQDCGPKYRVFFTPSENPFRLSRKSDRVRTKAEGDRSRISLASIEPIESRPMRCITVDSEDGRWLVGRDLIPTHNTKWLGGLALWRLYLSETGSSSPTCPGAKLAIWAAQNLNYSENSLREIAELVADTRLLGRELVHHRVVNGGHKIILTNGRTFRAVTATRKGGRSLSVDLAIIDELRELTDFEGWNALTPTTIARPYSQIIAATNAGDARSEVLISLRDGCLRRIVAEETDESRVGLFEWSIPPDADPRDQTQWHKANPSLGLLNQFSIDTLQGRLEAMERSNLNGFITEHLCLGVQALEAGIIPLEHWEATEDTESARAADADLYAAVDINYDRSRSYIAVAARRPDGNLHTEIMAAAAGPPRRCSCGSGRS